jgi:hypothetical protein
MRAPTSRFVLLATLLLGTSAPAQDYTPADLGQRPLSPGATILPDQFLRGFDPVTLYLPDNVGPGRGSVDDGGKTLRISPPWPGAWAWLDRKTLQFRPAEPWPPLARFSVEGPGARRVLTTMMSAPSSMNPPPDAQGLPPFRAFTLTFPQPLPLASLKQMLRLEVRDLPGLADANRHVVTDLVITLLPRARDRDPATYAVTMDREVPEGSRFTVGVSLALGDEGKVLWTGRVATRVPFHLQAVRCGSSSFSVAGGGSVPRDMALGCGTSGEKPQLVFSAPVKDLTLSALRKLVRMEPAVADLNFETYGSRVNLRGKFVPDVLYRMQVGAAPVMDDTGRALRDPGTLDVYFYLGWKSPFLRWSTSTAILESRGPRMLPLVGYGDGRADVRVYRVDPLATALWPFPDSPVVVNEEADPPFPGEEPAPPRAPVGLSLDQLQRHMRLLGSPLVSRVVELPLSQKGGVTRFGLDLGPLLDQALGRQRPGTYLVGLRRLTGPPERAYVRAQVTNLSLSMAEERHQAVLFVRTLDTVEPVRGARVVLEGQGTGQLRSFTGTTDESGKLAVGRLVDWTSIHRLSVQSGEDTLVLDPREPPPRFADNHWASGQDWLRWLMQAPPPPVNDKTLGFVFTERPIYRPGETVFIKGYLRRKVAGDLQALPDARPLGLQVEGPDGSTWALPITLTPLGGFSAEFQEKDLPTGEYAVTLREKATGAVLHARPFQVEAYRIPTFEVQLSVPSRVRLDGPFTAKAVARYYAGGNVAGQPVSWSVTRRPAFHVPAGRPGFLFASSTQFARPSSASPPDATTRSATLDDNGADELTVNPALDVDGSPRIYRLEATVTGPDDMPVSAAQEVKALPPFVLGLKVPRFLEKATDLKPEVLALGIDDKPVKGQEVLVRLYRRVWHNHLRETDFSTGTARYVTEQEDVKLGEKTVTTDVRPVLPAFPVAEAGVYVVEVSARDKLGRVQALSADLYVGGPQPLSWQKPREGVFELAADKRSYRPGDTARLLVQSPFQSGRALVVVEEPSGNTYTWRDVQGGKAVHELKIAAHHVPNLPVHVVLARGRSGDGQGDDARFRPATVAASLDLEVEPVRNQVTVRLDHPESARPGSRVDVTVSLADEQRRPLAGEVTLWLVDEAVLSLAKEQPLDPLTRLVERNLRTTTLRDTRNTTVGRLLEQEEEPGGDGDDDEDGTRGRVVRKNFQAVPFYQATLQVPATGRLAVPVTLSDDLTNFKVRAVAASGVMRLGHASSTLRVRLPVLVQPQLPRVLRQGDSFLGGGVARLLEGAEGPATVDLEVEGPLLGGPGKQAVELRANQARSVLFPLQVGPLPGGETREVVLRVGVTRLADGVGDVFQVRLPVLPDRAVERVAHVERLPEGPWASRPLPEPARPGTVAQHATFTSAPAILEMAAAMDYLATYPHGCLEQRLSQAGPLVVQGPLLKRLGFPGLAPVSAGHVRRLTEEVSLHQDDQGLVAFWPGAAGDVALTAQAVEFMHGAKQAGIPVEEKAYARAVDALKRALRSDFPGLLPDYRPNQQTAALKALARVGLLDEHYAVDLFHARGQMDATALGDLATALSAQPALFKSNLEVLRTHLQDAVSFKLVRGKPVFDKVTTRRPAWGRGYLGSDASAVAAVLEGMLRLDPGHARNESLRDALLSMATPTGGFGTTHDNRRALEALSLWWDRAPVTGGKRLISLGNQARLELDDTRKVVMAGVLLDTPLSGTLSGGEVGARFTSTYLPVPPGDTVTARAQGFIVSRSTTLFRANGTTDAEAPDRAGETLTVRVGDILELHARVTTQEERFHVALVVPFAAGLEPLNPSLQTSGADARPSQADSATASHVQRLDHETRYYFTRLPRGTYAFHARARAAVQGSFVHPPPWAEQMYRQEVNGRGEGMRVVVQAAEPP